MLDRLLSPVIQDPEAVARGRVVNLLALVVAGIIPPYILVTTLTTPGAITPAGFALLGAAVLLSLVTYALARRGRVRPAGYLLLMGLFVAISLYQLDPGNTITDLVMAPMLYVLVILPAGFVLHPLASFAVTTLALVYTAGLLWLAPPPVFAGYENQAAFWSNVVFAYAVAYVLSALAWVFNDGLDRALRQAQAQNQVLRQTAVALEGERARQVETAREIRDVAERLAEYSARQARGSNRQAGAVAQVSASVAELNQAAHEIARNAAAVDDAASCTLADAREGHEIAAIHDEAISQVEAQAEMGASHAAALEERLRRIGRVANIMSHIASQTQLVAFNATLEAAEAGVPGQRFGVVAAEVKDLASDSLKQVKLVDDILRQVREAGESVVSLSDEQMAAARQGTALTSRLRAATEAIMASATEMATRASQIQQATAQQQQANEQVLVSIQEIQTVVDRWVVSSYQMDELVSRLQSLAVQANTA
ncbi:MAG: hypothetical protein JXA93_20630 [Anaerolineae bacterium]|nr:hypothetical protein [Anaerolineae bacterium]